MKVRARFVGKNLSLGYIYGEDYELIIVGNRIECVSDPNPKYCPYSSVQSFLDNWKIIAQTKM